MLFIHATEHMRKLLFGGGDATRIGASDIIRRFAGTNGIGLVLFRKQLEDKRHTDISAVLRLFKIASAGIFVNLNGDLVHTRQRVQNAKIGLGIFELINGKNMMLKKLFVYMMVWQRMWI